MEESDYLWKDIGCISFISKVVNWEESEAWRFFLFLFHSCEFGEPDQVWEGYSLFNSEVMNRRNLSECWCALGGIVMPRTLNDFFYFTFLKLRIGATEDSENCGHEP
jgi:hypothetical protein